MNHRRNKTKSSKIQIILSLLLASAFTLTACGGQTGTEDKNMTRENKVKIGMTF